MDQRGRGDQSKRGKRHRGRGRGRGNITQPITSTDIANQGPVASTSTVVQLETKPSAEPKAVTAEHKAQESVLGKPETLESKSLKSTKLKVEEESEGKVEESKSLESTKLKVEEEPEGKVEESKSGTTEEPPKAPKTVSIDLKHKPAASASRKIAVAQAPILRKLQEPKSEIQGSDSATAEPKALQSKPVSSDSDATLNPNEEAMSSRPQSRRGSASVTLALEMPDKMSASSNYQQDPNYLTTPTTAETELDRGHSFSYPKSESGSTGFTGRNRRLSGVRGEDKSRRISIGLGGVPKKGYWGGMNDSSSDSDDSLLAQTSSNKRRKSGSFVMGPKLMGYTRRQWLILIVIAMVDFCSAVLISIQAPLYPREAIAKGVTATTYGILFGVFEITVFLMSPTFYNLLRKVDMKVMFNFGIFVTGSSAILFSFLDRIEDATLFVCCSFILRISEAIGDAAILTAAYAIVTLEFPDSVADTFTSLEAFLGIGFLVGPPLSGLLFDSNGFMLPFFLFGVLLIITGIVSLTILPKFREDNPSREFRLPAFLSLLQIPSVACAGLSILIATISLGYINSSLYAHLTQFMLSAPAIGAIFILMQGSYSLSAPVWNLLINRVSDPKWISILSTILIFIAFLFVGPVSFISLDAHLEVTCSSLALGGVALGGILVSGFIVIMKDTIDYGFPNNEATFGLCSGLYASVFAFGSFIGLSISGILYDEVGFRWGLLFPLSVHILLAIVTGIYILIGPKTRQGHRSRNSSAAFEESEPLLSPSPELAKSQQSPLPPQPGPASVTPPKTGKGSSYGTSTSYESIA